MKESSSELLQVVSWLSSTGHNSHGEVRHLRSLSSTHSRDTGWKFAFWWEHLSCDGQVGFSVLSINLNDFRSSQFTHQPLRRSFIRKVIPVWFCLQWVMLTRGKRRIKAEVAHRVSHPLPQDCSCPLWMEYGMGDSWALDRIRIKNSLCQVLVVKLKWRHSSFTWENTDYWWVVISLPSILDWVRDCNQ